MFTAQKTTLAQQDNTLQAPSTDPNTEFEENSISDVEKSREKDVANSRTNDRIKATENKVTTLEEQTKEKRRKILEENRRNGSNFEEECNVELSREALVLENQITIKVGDRKTRVDAIGVVLDEDGNYVLQIFEYKSSEKAPLTKNQRDLLPKIAKQGGIIVGNGKGVFKAGMIIPPGTEVKVIRRSQGGMKYVSDRFG